MASTRLVHSLSTRAKAIGSSCSSCTLDANLIRKGAVRDYADLARLGHVTRARVMQIMNLLLLTPDIQEEILMLPRASAGRDPISEREVRPIATTPGWRKQQRLWRAVQA